MSSIEIKMFKANLIRVGIELDKYKDFTSPELLTYCIKTKLNATLRKYNEEIKENTDLLSSAGNLRVMKAIAKIQKNNDKRALEAQIQEEEENKDD